MKRYIARTNVSINIVLASGANHHITFSSLTGGGSAFYTEDPEIENAMESHYKFGKLFRIDQHYASERTRSKPTKKAAASAPVNEKAHTPTATEEYSPVATEPCVETTSIYDDAVNNELDAEEDVDDAEDAAPEYKTIVVTDPDAAKAYLAEHFGISRTKLKKVETIKKVAAENGIFFQGI